MAFADLYEIRDRQSRLGQEILNVYHAERADVAFEAIDVGTAFLDTFIPSLLAIQSTFTVHSVIDVQSLDDPSDFTSITFSPNTGVRVGAQLSTFNAAAVQYNRRRTDMKNGQKRWDAGLETDIAGNAWAAPFLADLDVAAAALLNDWERTAIPGVKVAEYVIIKRVCIVTPPPVPCPGYRLPKDDAELILYHPITFIARATARSQVSRKQLI